MSSANLFLLFLLATLWGPSFLFIKVAVAEIPPLTMVTVRVGLAALLLYLFLRLRGGRLPGFGRLWLHFAVLGLLAHTIPFTLISWGEIYIDSAVAAILNGTTPLFTMLIAHHAIADERMSWSKLAGMLLGFLGLLLLVWPALVSGYQASTAGILAVTLASCSYGMALVYARRYLRNLPSMVAPTAQLLMATIYTIPLALYLERPFSLSWPSPQAVGSLVVLSVIGTALAFVVYYKIIEVAGATYLSMVTYLMPVFGVILGVLILNEQLTWNAYGGCGLILSGVIVVNGELRLSRRILKFEAGHNSRR